MVTPPIKQQLISRAMKQLHVPIENNAGLRAIADEVDILRQLDHPNLIKYYGVEVHTVRRQFLCYCSFDFRTN